MDHEKLLFYDIEVFQHDSLVVFKNYDNTVTHVLWNDDLDRPAKIASIIQGKILGGYNNHSYDDKILTYMLDGKPAEDIKRANDTIICGADPEIPVDIRIHSIDMMQQLLTHPSLKQIEGNLGMSIVESSVDFRQKEPLTQEQKDETVLYCCHDVEATIEAFKLREKSYFDVKESLIQMLPEDQRERAIRWNTTTISANLLKSDGKQSPKWSGLRGSDEIFRSLDDIPEEAWAMWEGLTLSNIKDKGDFVTTEKYGCEITFGVGGLHGAPTVPAVYENVVDLDVSSMYPSIIVLPKIRALGDATDLYDSMRSERIRIKKQDPTRAAAYKLILNSVYGNFKNEYSTLNNPFASASVTIYGQIAAMHLCHMLDEAGYQIFNINTDGVMIVDRPDPVRPYSEIQEEWQNRFGMMLEVEKFQKLIQRDVNNYIAINEDGSIKVKGGDTKKYHGTDPFGNCDARIIHIALVDYLVNGTPVQETFEKWLDKPEVWMYVLKAGNTFKDVEDENGNVQQNVNRVFAAKEGVENVTNLRKVKYDGQIIKFQSAPERMIVWNNDLSEISDIREFIDTEHYKAIVEDKIRQWTQPKKAVQKREKKAKTSEDKAEKPKKEKQIDKILKHFENVKKDKRGWKFSCPCKTHGQGKGDRKPSAYIYRGVDRFHIGCFAGCEEQDIIRDAGLSWEDLGGDSFTPVSDDWMDYKIENLKIQLKNPDIRLADHYDYTDENGKYLYTKIRYFIGDLPQKQMSFIRKTGNTYADGKGLLHPDPVLYNLKNLKASVRGGYPVYYVEGEKDVKTLEEYELTATTAGGAADWKRAMALNFVGARVIILADNDKPGLDSANKVAKDISRYCFAYKILTPSSKEKGDITDYLKGMGDGKPEGDMESIKARLDDIPWELAPFAIEKFVGKELKTVINDGLLKEFIEKYGNFFIKRRVTDNKDSLYVYNGICYQERNIRDLRGLVQDYIPNRYMKNSTVSNVANLIADSSHKRISMEDVEKNKQFIICNNGVLDLNDFDGETGTFTLKAHSPRYKIMNQIHADYDPDAECPIFMQYMSELCTDQDGKVDTESMMMVQEYCGLIISNIDVMKTKKSLVMSSREGNSGKSQLFKVLEFLIGADEMVNISISEMNRGENKFSLANIVGKRLIYQPDGTDIVIRDSSIFKQLVGGDRITIEGKGKDTFDYHFKGGVIIACNGVPTFSDDKGNHVFERLMVLPITRSIPIEKRDPDIADKMEKEKSGILNWMLEGLVRYLENERLTESERSAEAENELRMKADTLYQYIFTYYVITKDVNDVIRRSDLEDGYKEWYKMEYPDEDDRFAVKRKNIQYRLSSYGVKYGKGNVGSAYRSVYRYIGIRKKTDEELAET